MRVPENADRDFVAGAFIIKNNRILFLRHKKYDMWLQPGGHVEERETPDEAAIRETMEEVGLEIEILDGFMPDTSFENKSEDLPQPFNINLHRIEEGRWHLDFQYLARPVNEISEKEYSDEDMKWFSEDELEDEHLNMPENARKTGLKALEEI
ncbi:NUDIX hydrolase [Candidatus Haloredivivus sp. G17]|jgi:8-oxo-dGTP pyrophosphatase MutT (NUDIX family)|nr:NUDIX hydrolase [Candidatus Haloredivivus sp. G17]